jgi:fructose-1,6-bisphosphatase/inositol monophosphatase family enzyme
MDGRLRTYGSLAVALLLVLAGTLATGVLPATVPYQLLAGLVIVAGFAVGYLGLVGFELPE